MNAASQTLHPKRFTEPAIEHGIRRMMRGLFAAAPNLLGRGV